MRMKHSTLVATATICLLVSACTKNNSTEEQPIQLTEEKSVAAMNCCESSISASTTSITITTSKGTVTIPSIIFYLANIPPGAFWGGYCVTPCTPPTPPEQKWKTETEAIVDAFRKAGELPPSPCPYNYQSSYSPAQVQTAYNTALSYEGTARLAGETYNSLVAAHSGPYLPSINEFAAMATHLNTMVGRFFTFYSAAEADYAFGSAASDQLVIAIFVDLGEAETGVNRSRAAVLMPGHGSRDVITWPNGGTMYASRAAGGYHAGDFFEDDHIKAGTVYFVYTPGLCY